MACSGIGSAGKGSLEQLYGKESLHLLRLGLGADPRFADSAGRVGRAIAEHGFGLVYGGGRVGLMGIVADAVLAAGGRAIGVIPEPLASKEIAHQSLSELHVVRDMHERKAMMASRSAAFLTLPGGIGTFEEFFETLSWATLGLHDKPMGVLNVAGYFDPLMRSGPRRVTAIRQARTPRASGVFGEPGELVVEIMSRAGAERQSRRSIWESGGIGEHDDSTAFTGRSRLDWSFCRPRRRHGWGRRYPSRSPRTGISAMKWTATAGNGRCF